MCLNYLGKVSMPVKNIMHSGTVHIKSADKDTNGELDCSFKAMGPSVITWYKNDKLLDAHSDKVFTYNNCFVTLYFTLYHCLQLLTFVVRHKT